MSDWVNLLVTMGPQAGPAEAAPQATAAAPHRPGLIATLMLIRVFWAVNQFVPKGKFSKKVPEFSRQAACFQVAFSLNFIYACTDYLWL